MKIVYKTLDELKPYENNPRINDDAVESVASSIEEFGFKVPMVITMDGVIVTGHTRYRAAQLIGMQKVPCIIADDLDDEQIQAFRLVDNKVSELSEWDFSKLESELSKINMEFDMDSFGFDMDFELDAENEPQAFANEEYTPTDIISPNDAKNVYSDGGMDYPEDVDDEQNYGEDYSPENFGTEFTLPSGDRSPISQLSVLLHQKQLDLILACVEHVYNNGEVTETFGNSNHNGNGIYEVVRQWAEQKKLL